MPSEMPSPYTAVLGYAATGKQLRIITKSTTPNYERYANITVSSPRLASLMRITASRRALDASSQSAIQSAKDHTLVSTYSVFDKIRAANNVRVIEPAVATGAIAPLDHPSGIEHFKAFAEPKDVSMQFGCLQRTAVKDPKVWCEITQSALRHLRFLRTEDITGISRACMWAGWRSDALLAGLTDALRCLAEIRRSNVAHTAVIFDCFRRLEYVPSQVALNTISAELRRTLPPLLPWMARDISRLYYFYLDLPPERKAKLDDPKLIEDLRQLLAENLGHCGPMEIAQISGWALRKHAQLEPEDAELFSAPTLIQNFTRADHIPYRALLYMVTSLLKHQAELPPAFVRRTREEVVKAVPQLSAGEIAQSLSLLRRAGLIDSSVLRAVAQGVEANLDNFSSAHLRDLLSDLLFLSGRGAVRDALLGSLASNLLARHQAPSNTLLSLVFRALAADGRARNTAFMLDEVAAQLLLSLADSRPRPPESPPAEASIPFIRQSSPPRPALPAAEQANSAFPALDEIDPRQLAELEEMEAAAADSVAVEAPEETLPAPALSGTRLTMLCGGRLPAHRRLRNRLRRLEREVISESVQHGVEEVSALVPASAIPKRRRPTPRFREQSSKKVRKFRKRLRNLTEEDGDRLTLYGTVPVKEIFTLRWRRKRRRILAKYLRLRRATGRLLVSPPRSRPSGDGLSLAMAVRTLEAAAGAAFPRRDALVDRLLCHVEGLLDDPVVAKSAKTGRYLLRALEAAQAAGRAGHARGLLLRTPAQPPPGYLSAAVNVAAACSPAVPFAQLLRLAEAELGGAEHFAAARGAAALLAAAPGRSARLETYREAVRRRLLQGSATGQTGLAAAIVLAGPSEEIMRRWMVGSAAVDRERRRVADLAGALLRDG